MLGLDRECALIFYEEAALGCSWTADLSAGRHRISTDRGDVVSLENVRAIWLRRWGYPIYPSSFSAHDVSFAYSEVTSFVSSLRYLTRARWLNSIEGEQRASLKIHQLKLAREVGFRVPDTVVTSDPDVVRHFKSRHSRVIFKPLSGSAPPSPGRSRRALQAVASRYSNLLLKQDTDSENRLVFTEELTDTRLQEIASLKWSPTIFQELIEKKYELRVTIVGDRVFTCRIDSQADFRTSLDFRHMNIVGMVPHVMVTVSRDLVEKLLSMMRQLELGFGCFDLIVPASGGDPIFLEVNPSGQWLWIEDITKANISLAVAKELAGVE